MRRRALLSWLLALMLLAGCAGGPEDERAPESQEAAPVEIQRGPQEEPRLTAALTETQPRALTEDEVLSAYDRAVTAYGWFERTPLACAEESKLVDDRAYQRVEAPSMDSMEDLRTYLRSLFSTEVTERLLDTGGDAPMYREIEGALFVSGAGRQADPCKGEIQADVEQISDTEYLVNVTVELLDSEDQRTATGVECWSFPYAFVDGRWVFTEFRLVD